MIIPRSRNSLSPLYVLGLGLLSIVLWSGCSIKRMAVNQLGDALAAGGSTFSSDDDPELIREALPFSLKLTESLLEESPDHQGLLLTASSGFTQYAYAFLLQDAEMMEEQSFSAAETLRGRARKMYLRALAYGLRGLERAHPGIETALRQDPLGAVPLLGKKDVPLIYWTAAAWGAAISISKNNPQLISEQVIVEALIDRALELEEDFNRGAVHSLLISYEMSRQGGEGDSADRARRHYQRAVELSEGLLAGPHVAYAEAVMVQKQDSKEFKLLLERALSIDPDALPEARLENLIVQKRARWLLSRMDELFLITGNP